MIRIQLYSSNSSPKLIDVDPNDSLKILEPYYETIGQMFLCHNNSVVFSSFSFKFLGIKDNDIIYAIPGLVKPKIISEFDLKPSNIAQKKSSIPLQRILEEHSASLIDQFFKKVEGSSAHHRKLYSAITDFSSKSDNNSSCSSFIPNCSPTNPSTEVLPAIWSKSN